MLPPSAGRQFYLFAPSPFNIIIIRGKGGGGGREKGGTRSDISKRGISVSFPFLPLFFAPFFPPPPLSRSFFRLTRKRRKKRVGDHTRTQEKMLTELHVFRCFLSYCIQTYQKINRCNFRGGPRSVMASTPDSHHAGGPGGVQIPVLPHQLSASLEPKSIPIPRLKSKNGKGFPEEGKVGAKGLWFRRAPRKAKKTTL